MAGGARRSSWESLAEALAAAPGTWRRLLVDHVAAPGTGRCRACTIGGTGLPGARWPCGPHLLAVRAREIHSRARVRR